MVENENPFENLADELTDDVRINSRPLTLATHNNSQVIIFYDTGAPGSLVSKQTHDVLFSHITLQPDDESRSLCDLNGNI